MNRVIIINLLIVLGLFFQSCEKNDLVETEPILIQLNEKGKSLVNATSNFGIEVFQKTGITETDKKNWMISPYSISIVLAMTYNGANGDTKVAIENVLGIGGLSTEDVNINYKQITDALLTVDKNVELSIANSIWYRNTFSVLQDFIEHNDNFYNAQVSALDFDDSGAVDIINSWVAANTNQKISSIINEINAESIMFLINAIYFKGVWKYQFDLSLNDFHNFYYEDGTVKQIEMMTQTAEIKQFANEDIIMVELPYGQGNWVMDLILPSDTKSADEIISDFTPVNWNNWTGALSSPDAVSITFPSFKFDYDATLNTILTSLGMGIGFNPYSADFSKINSDGQLYISEVKHKTFIEVNEQGTEAAAATSVGIGVTSIGGNGIIFDKPFLFIIREVSTGTIMFMGKVGDPVR